MTVGTRSLGFVVAAAVAWHLLGLLTPAWVSTAGETRGRDFASYYYAVHVAADGGNPYDKVALNQAARADDVRRGVHPFLYAPPFLLGMAWALPLDLSTAFHTWFWLHELAAIAAMIVLWRWWRPLHPAVGAWIVVVFAVMTAVPNNHAMGQANFPGLALALAGLWQTDRGRPWVGGALMGAACMLKMSPALWVVWWLARREGRAALAAVVAGAGLSVLTLPLAGPAVQLGFYSQILPTFSSGDYNDLAISIGLFGNHSIPNVVDQLLPGVGRVLSPAGQAISSVLGLGLLGALCVLFSAPRADAWQRAGQAAAIGVLILLVPVYTYEHHLVFAIPAAVIAGLAVVQGRLPAPWLAPVALSITVLLFDLQVIKDLALSLPDSLGGLSALMRELKFLALVGLLASTATLGARRADGLVAT